MNRKHFDHFHIAGFTFYEGVLAFSQLQIGTELLLKPEPDNRYDENAVAIWYNDHKLGFVPRSSNQAIAAILNAGHLIFEARIQQLKPNAHPEDQVHVVVWVKSKEPEKQKNRGDG
ncbi:MAG: HIRAN domain-containing protein [Bacteroidales bacterium]|nr:HIRAN domain-containing protein [Bacteroidales bacterium]